MKEWKGIDGRTLKIIATIAMVLDHVGAVILMRIMIDNGLNELETAGDAQMGEWLSANGAVYLAYNILRLVGRIAFPVFCYLLLEGFLHTGDWKKYAVRLGVFAVIAEVPFDLALSGTVWNAELQNVFFTLWAGLLTLVVCSRIEKKTEWRFILRWVLEILAIVCGMAVAGLLRSDYGAMGVLLIVVFFMFRRKRQQQILFGGLAALTMDTFSVLGMFPIAVYNGERGKQKKYFFYLFYPLHLLVLYLICCALGIGGISTI